MLHVPINPSTSLAAVQDKEARYGLFEGWVEMDVFQWDRIADIPLRAGRYEIEPGRSVELKPARQGAEGTAIGSNSPFHHEGVLTSKTRVMLSYVNVGESDLKAKFLGVPAEGPSESARLHVYRIRLVGRSSRHEFHIENNPFAVKRVFATEADPAP